MLYFSFQKLEIYQLSKELAKEGCIWKYFEKGEKINCKNEQLYCI